MLLRIKSKVIEPTDEMILHSLIYYDALNPRELGGRWESEIHEELSTNYGCLDVEKATFQMIDLHFWEYSSSLGDASEVNVFLVFHSNE